MVVSLTQNPLFRVLDGQGRDFASNPPAPMPEIIGPKTGQPRSSEQSAIENGFRSTSDMQCRMAEVTVGTHSQSAAFSRWYYTDGSKSGLEALVETQYRIFAPETI
ncbi:hypothetical protein SAMN02927923_03316 [Microvirga guangxiensis]|uniref:Uncharacterized protein n=1 Tax=Microvirga guangxiensis TaxID=549386 RepID=A0A1G5KHE0_9HYPH|nr:hypothetical protein SAMN02927923_03316 [Microvirga guangxiensis]